LMIAASTTIAAAACGGGATGGDTSSGGGTTSSATTSSGGTVSTTSTTTSTGTTGGTCALEDDTTQTSTMSASGCHVLDRDTSAWQDARTAAGLSGFWLNFSCRVTLSVSNGVVKAAFDGQPDYKSNYFKSSDPCHEDYTGAIQNPNFIATKSSVVEFPL